MDKKATRVAVPVPKVTAVELAKRKEEEQAAMQAQAEAAKKKELRMSNEADYERLVGVANRNREDDIIDARTLETALAQIGTLTTPDLPADRHPERRLKASYKVCMPHLHTGERPTFRNVNDPPLSWAATSSCILMHNSRCRVLLDDRSEFYTVVERFEMFDNQLLSSKWSSNPLKCSITGHRVLRLPCHNSLLAIGDNFIGFSFSCVTHDILPENFT